MVLFLDEGKYCQSMNFIAAFLLMYMSKEEAFYTQVCINRTLFKGYYTDNLVLLFIQMNIL